MQVIREDPNIEELNKQSLVCADLHYHSTYSDGSATPEQIAKQAKELNIWFAITDHNEINGSLESMKFNKFSIPAIEVTSNEKQDILIYFYNKIDLILFYKKIVEKHKTPNRGINMNTISLSFQTILENAKKYKCVTVLPHPFTMKPKNSSKFIENNSELLKYIDCIEVVNGLMTKSRNVDGERWCLQKGKVPFGGSDGHHLEALGAVVVAVKCNNDIESFLDNIKKGNLKVVGKELSMRKAFKSRTTILRRNIKIRMGKNE